MTKALLFLNGEPPKNLPADVSDYQIIACTDGAYHEYLANSAILPHYIIGDFDSIKNAPISSSIKLIHTPDQNKNDYEKALDVLIKKGATKFDIYGASGRASDHFLGNLCVSLRYYQHYKLRFYDDYGHYFFANKKMRLDNIKDKTISFLPLPSVNALTLTGVKYTLKSANLMFDGLISLRNKAITNPVFIEFEAGNLLVFISNE